MKKNELENMVRNIVKEELTKLLTSYTGTLSNDKKLPEGRTSKTPKLNAIHNILLETANEGRPPKSGLVKNTQISPELHKKLKQSPMLSILEQTAKEVAATGNFGIEDDESISEIMDDDELDD